MIEESLTLVPFLIGYAVKRDGTVWTDVVYTGYGPNRTFVRSGVWRQMSIKPQEGRGYRSINVSTKLVKDHSLPIGPNKRKRFYVHNLILTTFIGPRPNGLECRHLDGDGSNCDIKNLAWGTSKENKEDKIRHGTDSKGEKNPRAKKTDDDVREIRKMIKDGVSNSVIAKKFGISPQNVCDIKHRRKWSHIE